MNDLLSLQKIFNEALFRIPDYQRGYSWNKTQLEEFWSDLISLLPCQDHYTGMLSLKALKSSDIYKSVERWKTEKWLVEAGYTIYEVVDGQQRMTTLIILINEILYFCKKNDIHEINNTLLAEIEEKYLYKIKNNDIYRTYKFGYEEDNPSYLYFRHEILEEANKGSLEETFYTLNLSVAKKFFSNEIEKLVNNKGIEELENIYRKITLHLKFNIYYIEDDFNVFVAFETMNNRGKKLSYLELLKNRLIYLSTLFDNDEDEKEIVRQNINDTWKEIYGYLGKNKNHPLNDDEFLQNHWMIYFGYQTRKIKGNQTIPYHTYLLKKHFIHQNIDPDNVYIPDLSDLLFTEEQLEEEREIIENIVIDESEDRDERKINLTLSGINDYVNSLKKLIPYWYEMYFPNKDVNNELSNYLYRLKYLGHVNARPLITVVLSKADIPLETKIKCLKYIERFNFLHYRFNGYSSTYNNSVFYNMARDLYYGTKNIDDVLDIVMNVDYLSSNHVIITTGIIDKFKRLFNRDGFYSWGTSKYLLYVYDLSYTETLAEQHLNPDDYFKSDSRDSYSVEHIYPQKAVSEYWTTRFNMYSEKERKKLCGSLGNLLPLSKRINSRLQNSSFDVKKERYEKGSKSEIQVSRKDEWTPKIILQRGLEMLKFMETEWEFVIPNLADKKRILGLDFMINQGDELIDVTEPYIEEKVDEPKSKVFDNEDFKRLSLNAKQWQLDIYNILDEYCVSMSDDVFNNTTKNYIAWSNGKVFFEFHFMSDFIKSYICAGEYHDPLNKVVRLGENYNWVNNNRLDIYENDDIEYIKSIIKQSYEKTF